MSSYVLSCPTMSAMTTRLRISDWELEWTFGDRLRKARRVVGVDLATFGRTLGVSSQAVSQWETRHSTPRSAHEIARRLEAAYGIPAKWLLGAEDGLEKLPRLDSNQEPSGYTSLLAA